ncbi:hypothetical protein IJG04_03445 [Candidatus Saccharibacteria bacterium]|nr:hypothetical protein [Candidatus Saccharibacteria bacterium]
MDDRDVFILEVIIDFCDRISDSINKNGNSFDDYNSNLDFQDACMLRALQIGENVNNLSKTNKGKLVLSH